MRRTAALIVGGGPAGSAAAITLARGGLAPTLIERTVGAHDVVCGGFLGWDALAALARLGIAVEALGARPIQRLRLVAAGRQVETRLPRPAAGLSRLTLDAAMLAAAANAGAEVVRGRAVRNADADARTVRLHDNTELATDALFLATGKHELRGVARPLAGHGEPPAIGLRAALPASPVLAEALTGMIELHLFDGGYAGLLLQEDGTTNVCLSLSKARMSAAGGVEALVAQVAADMPLLGERLAAAAPLDRTGEEWQAIAGVPYGWRRFETAPGVFRLGDQSAVISSLAGDGVAIALASGVAAATTLLRDGPAGAAAFQAAFARRSARPLRVADILRRTAETNRWRPTLRRLASVAPLARLAATLTRIG
jgi:flavin-dependent dehydrogenase